MNLFSTHLLAFVLATLVAVPASAQHQQHHGQAPTQQADSTRDMTGMMPGDMMQMHMRMVEQAMADPLRRAAMLVRVLPTMQEPLALSDEEAASLRQTAQRFRTEQQAHMEQAARVQEQLRDLLASDDADPARVESLLVEAASHHAQLQALAYRTARQMQGGLSDEQRAKLSEMTPMAMHHHMMTNMTMMEMMQLMHGEMMSGGMGQEGMMEMMQDGMMQER